MKNNKHTLYTIIIIICSLASIGFYVYIFSLIEKNNNSAHNLAIEIKKIDDQKKKVMQIKKDIENTKDIRFALSQHFLTSNDIVRFFDSLDTESRLAKVGFSIVNASEVKTGEPFSFSLKTIGNYDQNYYFLKILESLPYDLRINNFALKYTAQIPQTNALNATTKDIGGWEMSVDEYLQLKEE